MVMLLAKIGGGILASLAAIYCLYLFMTGLEGGVNFLFLGLTLLLGGGGVFLLITGAKSAERIVSGAESVADLAPVEADSGDLEKLLKRNNQITSEWGKTQSQRDQIKLLEVQANAERGEE